MENLTKKVLNSIEKHFDLEPSGHDVNHLLRTCNLAEHIQIKEGGDKEVISLSSIVHDLHRVIKITGKTYCSPAESLPQIKKILSDLRIPQLTINKVLHCVEFHEQYSFSSEGKTVHDIETLILQDADNLDAIGAIGIARTFSYGGAHNVPIFDNNTTIKKGDFSEGHCDPSTIHHFYNKLLRLEKNMNTKTGRKMTKARTEFMKKFLDQFFAEWEGLI